MPDEVWKPVVGYEGWYEVSSLGRVRAVAKVDRSGACRGKRLLSCRPSNRGYVVHHLTKNGCVRGTGAHRLVAMAFIGPCPDGMQVNHKDGVKTNNAVENLEYVTPSENVRHAWDMGLSSPAPIHWSKSQPESFAAHLRRIHQIRVLPTGESHHNSTLQDRDIRVIRRYCRRFGRGSGRTMADRFGVTEANISNIIHRKTWTHIED